MLNRIDPKGHQYASDVKMKEIKERYTKEEKDQALPNNPRKDPYRYTALEFLPAISNINSNNCFINAVLQLLKNTNISVNFSFCPDHPLTQVMIKLNNGESISIKLERIGIFLCPHAEWKMHPSSIIFS